MENTREELERVSRNGRIILEELAEKIEDLQRIEGNSQYITDVLRQLQRKIFSERRAFDKLSEDMRKMIEER